MNKYIFTIPFLFFCCGGVEPPTRIYDGVVSLNTNLSASEPFSNYTAEYQAVFNARARGAQTAAPWASLNPTGSTYDLVAISNPYFGLTALKDMGFEAIFLNIPIIAIDKRSMPADIITLPFDDPAVKARFRALLDIINDQLHDKVKYIAFGNEVDTYFATYPEEWEAYISLVEDARNYIRSIRPEILVAVTTTFQGATVNDTDQISLLNATLDVVSITYYPISSNFIPRDPASVKEDVLKMIAIANDKPIVVQEWGYPSSVALGSSDQKQSDFFSYSFDQLSLHGQAHFPFVSFFKYRDWDDAHVKSLTGQTAGGNFYEFMSSLGLKRNDGSTKAAWKVIEAELKK